MLSWLGPLVGVFLSATFVNVVYPSDTLATRSADFRAAWKDLLSSWTQTTVQKAFTDVTHANSTNPCAAIATQLSSGSSYQDRADFEAAHPRWSTYRQPSATCVITAGVESDVAIIVKYAGVNRIPLVVSNGGRNWNAVANQNDEEILVDLSKLVNITEHLDQRHDGVVPVTVQAGVGMRALRDHLATVKPPLLAPLSNCLCPSFLGAALPGGFSWLSGTEGQIVGSITAMSIVTPQGEAVRASADQNSDLFWAIKGAASSFGIVTSVELNAKDATVLGDNQTSATDVGFRTVSRWLGTFTYPISNLQTLVSAMDGLTLSPRAIYHLRIMGLPGTSQPIVLIVAGYTVLEGSPNTNVSDPENQKTFKQAEAEFAPLLSVGPSDVKWNLESFDHWGDEGDPACALAGARSPFYGFNLDSYDPNTLQRVYNSFANFFTEYGSQLSFLLFVIEVYPTDRRVQLGQELGLDAAGSFPFRNKRGIGFVGPTYLDASLDDAALAFNEGIVDIINSPDGCYSNFTSGNEEVSSVYAQSLDRLKSLKMKYDPANLINGLFPLV